MEPIVIIKGKIKKRYDVWANKLLAKHRRKKINNTNFSIICNNCWGGYVYRYFGLAYLSPTIGLYINPKDFLLFLSDIKGYLEKPLKFINPQESKYYHELKKKNQLNIPIGKINNVEIVFLHYKSESEAYEKWNRRVSRVNYDNLIIKFSKMNNATIKELEAFDQLHFNKMFMFVNTPELTDQFQTAVYYKGQEDLNELKSDTIFYDKYINLYTLINSKKFPFKKKDDIHA